jgi:hypothetical protein
VHFRAEQSVQQEVAVRRPRFLASEHQRALQSTFGGRCRGLATVIRLRRSGGHQHRRIPGKSIREEEFQLPRLVPAEGKAGLVVAFDQDPRPTQGA